MGKAVFSKARPKAETNAALKNLFRICLDYESHNPHVIIDTANRNIIEYLCCRFNCHHIRNSCQTGKHQTWKIVP